MIRYTLSKQERLSSLKDIELLFAEGKSLTKYPVRLVWRNISEASSFPAIAMFSVSKKKFPKAVDRNRIKRLLRESYRQLKPSLYTAIAPDNAFHIGIIYIANEILDQQSIQNSIAKALERLITESRPLS